MGAVHVWSFAVLALLATIAFHINFGPQPERLISLFKKPSVWLGISFFLFSMFQLVPMPPCILKVITPATYELYWDHFPEYPEKGQWLPITIYAWATIYEVIKMAAYGMIFLIVVDRMKSVPDEEDERTPREDPRFGRYVLFGAVTSVFSILLHSLVDFNLHIPSNAFYMTVLLGVLSGSDLSKRTNVAFGRILNGLLAAGFTVAIFGIIYKFSGEKGKIYWVLSKDGSGFGPFINYDHFAGYMQMCSILGLSAFAGSLRISSFFDERGFLNKLLWFSTREAARTMLYLFMAAAMIASLLLSTSRGGILSFTAAFLFYIFMVLIRMKRGRRGRIIFAAMLALCLIAVLSAWLGPEEWLARAHTLDKVIKTFIHEPSVFSEIRPWFWRDTIEMIKDFPLTGTGLGTFCHLFPKYRTFPLSLGFLRYAHNDYLQFAAETGVAGCLFISIFMILYLKKLVGCLKNIR